MLREKRKKAKEHNHHHPAANAPAKRHERDEEVAALKAKAERYERALLEALEQMWDGRFPLQAVERALRRNAA